MENLSRLRIVFVDDDPDDHFLTGKALRNLDPSHTVEHIYSGTQLMDMLFTNGKPKELSQLPDIIFLDLNMPMIDGYRVLSEMKKAAVFSSVAVYILSSSPYEKDILKWKEMGVADFFVKPYQLRRLSEIVEDVLSRHAASVPNALKHS